MDRMVYDLIMSILSGSETDRYDSFAENVQMIASGVSYATETADPEKARELLARLPELAIVQVLHSPMPGRHLFVLMNPFRMQIVWTPLAR